jgi:hypothetical protein
MTQTWTNEGDHIGFLKDFLGVLKVKDSEFVNNVANSLVNVSVFTDLCLSVFK